MSGYSDLISEQSEKVLQLIYLDESWASFALDVLQKCIAHVGKVSANNIVVDGVDYSSLPGRIDGEKKRQSQREAIYKFLTQD